MTIDVDEAKVARNEFGLWLGWTLATAAGLLLGFLPFALIISDLDLGLARVLIPLWTGFLVGAFQWLVLRRYLTRSADWILNGGAGWSVGYALGLLIIQLLSGSFLGTIVGYILFGLLIAVFQWPVLRHEIPNATPWILSSILGWGLGFFMSGVLLDVLASNEFDLVLSTAVTSTVTGLAAGAVTGLALVWIVRQPERVR